MVKKQILRIMGVALAVVMLVSVIPAVSTTASLEDPLVEDVIIAQETSGYKALFPDVVLIPQEQLPAEERAEYPIGKLLVAYYKNTGHVPFTNSKAAMGTVQVVESKDNGRTWSAPQTLLTTDTLISYGIGSESYPMEARDPNFAILSDGTVILTFFARNLNTDSTTRTFITYSRDGGKTFATPTQIPAVSLDAWCAKRGDIAVFEDDQMLIPVYGMGASYSGQAGVNLLCTLQEDGTFRFDGEYLLADTGTLGAAINEVSLVATEGGTVYAMAREAGYVWRSDDRGVTWERIARETVIGGTQMHQPGLKLLSDGSIFATWTVSSVSSTATRPVYAKRFFPALGWDATTAKLVYRNDLGGGGDMGDPSSCELPNGEVLVIYYVSGTATLGGTFIDPDEMLDENEEQQPNTAVANGNIITVKAGDGYELRAGSLFVKDAKGNYFVPERVGYREGGNASQYKIPANAVAPFTVEADFYQPTEDDLNMGLVGYSVTDNQGGGLRFIHRLNVIESGDKLYMMVDGANAGVKEYGLLIAAQVVVNDPEGLTVEAAAESAYVQRYAWPETNRYFDYCEDHVDVAVHITGIETAGAGNLDIITRTYVELTDGTIAYGDVAVSNYDELQPRPAVVVATPANLTEADATLKSSVGIDQAETMYVYTKTAGVSANHEDPASVYFSNENGYDYISFDLYIAAMPQGQQSGKPYVAMKTYRHLTGNYTDAAQSADALGLTIVNKGTGVANTEYVGSATWGKVEMNTWYTMTCKVTDWAKLNCVLWQSTSATMYITNVQGWNEDVSNVAVVAGTPANLTEADTTLKSSVGVDQAETMYVYTKAAGVSANDEGPASLYFSNENGYDYISFDFYVAAMPQGQQSGKPYVAMKTYRHLTGIYTDAAQSADALGLTIVNKATGVANSEYVGSATWGKVEMNTWYTMTCKVTDWAKLNCVLWQSTSATVYITDVQGWNE